MVIHLEASILPRLITAMMAHPRSLITPHTHDKTRKRNGSLSMPVKKEKSGLSGDHRESHARDHVPSSDHGLLHSRDHFPVCGYGMLYSCYQLIQVSKFVFSFFNPPNV